MAVAQLADAAPAPVGEGRLDAAVRQRRVALEDQDLAVTGREGERAVNRPAMPAPRDQQFVRKPRVAAP